jgi:GH24 family phage-related lysozyme (muramidase)
MADQRLSNVIGAPFPEHVLTQLNIRAARNSTGYGFIPTRSDEELLFLANKSSWVKLTSSVNVVAPPGVSTLKPFYQRLGLEAELPNSNDLRKAWILEAGTSTSDGGAGINLRKGIGPQGAYGLGGTEELGYRPMPGLTSVTIDTVGTLGSLRQANISFKVWNMNQLNIIEALYFRLGYSMLLEWGHTQFFTNVRQGSNLLGTFEANTYGIDPFTNPRKEIVQQNIARRSLALSGNYDGMLGIVTNFNWSFNQEGGYDCSIKLVGLGAVMDSLRINLSYKMPGILFSNYQREQKRKRDLEADLKAQKERLAQLEQQTKEKIAAGLSRKEQGLDETPVPAAKNATEIYTIVAARDFSPNTNPEQQKPFLDGISIFPNYQAVIAFEDANGKTQYPLNQVPDYYYPAKQGPPIRQNEMNGLKYPSAGLYLNTIPNKRTKWQLIPAGVSLENGGQKARISMDWLNKRLYRHIVYETNPVPDAEGLPDIPTNRGFLATDNTGTKITDSNQLVQKTLPYMEYSPSNPFFRPIAEVLNTIIVSDVGLGRTGIVDETGKAISPPIGAMATSFIVRYDHAAKTYQKNLTREPGQKAFYLDVEYRLGEGDTAKSLLTALDNWATNSGVMSIIGLTPYDQTVSKPKITDFGNKEIFKDILITAKLENLSIKGDVIFKFNNTAFIAEVLPNAAPSKTTGQATGVAANGNTGGTVNTVVTQQTDPSDKFASSLHAMLTAVKSFMQDKAISAARGGAKKGIIVESIADITKIMYQDGVLKDVFQTGSASSHPIDPNSQTFDVTAYAKKGFNSNVMLTPASASLVSDIDFAEKGGICTGYAIKYAQAESDLSINYPIYIKLGYLMSFLNSMCLIYDSTVNTDKHPYVYLDFNPNTNLCLTIPEHLSVDPFTCLIPFQGTDQDYLNIYPKELQKTITNPLKQGVNNAVSAVIPPFKNPNNQYQGRTMEILLNVDYLLSVVDQYTSSDPTHAVYLKGFLDTVVAGINKSTGNVNMFRVSYRDDTNTVIIRDDQFVPPIDGEAYMAIRSQYLSPGGPNGRPEYGQLPIFGAYSLVREMEFRTDLSTKMASMIAISAQAETGSANSKDYTPLSSLNPNYVDAYKPKVGDVTEGAQNTSSSPSTSTNKKTVKGQDGNNDANQAKQFNAHILNVYYGDKNTPIARDKVDFAINYYIERMSKVKADNKITQAAPFIPANISITIDGIAGIVMGNAFTIPEDRLPTSLKGENGKTEYGFIVVGLTHVLDNNQWLTKIRGQMIRLRDYSKYGTAQQIAAVPDIFGSFNSGRNVGSINLNFLNLNDDWLQIAFDYIAKNESFISKPQWDYNKYRAGYGSDNFITADGQELPVELTTVFTLEDATRTLKYNIAGPYKSGVVRELGQAYWDPLNDRQKAALVSYAYNAGAGALSIWGIRQAIQADKPKEEVAALIERGPITAKDTRTGRVDTLDALIRRRREEAQLYIS